MHPRSIAALLLIACIAAVPSLSPAQAKTQRVGPTQFHKQMQIPNALGKTGSAANSDDGYTPPSRSEQRQKKRLKRQRDQNASNTESRTASETATNSKRKGRRDRQHDAKSNRLQNLAMDKAASRLGEAAKSAVND